MINHRNMCSETAGENDYNISRAPGNSLLIIPSRAGYEVVRKQDVVMIQAEGSYCRIHTVDGGSYFLSHTLKRMCENFRDKYFYRVHQSFLVNMNYLKRISSGDSMKLEMRNGMHASVSRSQKKEFLNQMKLI